MPCDSDAFNLHALTTLEEITRPLTGLGSSCASYACVVSALLRYTVHACTNVEVPWPIFHGAPEDQTGGGRPPYVHTGELDGKSNTT